MNNTVGCETYFDLEAEIRFKYNLTSTDSYCKEKDTKYCQMKCPEIRFSELQCALPRCPNITKDLLTDIYPENKGATLHHLPESHERFNVNSNATFVCKDKGK